MSAPNKYIHDAYHYGINGKENSSTRIVVLGQLFHTTCLEDMSGLRHPRDPRHLFLDIGHFGGCLMSPLTAH